MPDLRTPFGRATQALALLAVDPLRLGGLTLRARSGPVRDGFTTLLPHLSLPMTRLHASMTDEALFGGIDLSATLTHGHTVRTKGLLADPSALVLTMAERCGAQLAARLAMTLDAGSGHCLIALDEGSELDEHLPSALSERLAFHIDLNDTALGDVHGLEPDAEDLAAARARLATIASPGKAIAQTVLLCAQLGIRSARAPLFALHAARANAALRGAEAIEPEDVETAATLTLAHRATQMPSDPAPEEEAPDQTDAEPQESQEQSLDLPDELLLDAVRAMLPDDLLARLAARKSRQAKGAGSGAKTRSKTRGRPLPARPGKLGTGARIDLIATLRTAAPWQKARARSRPDHSGLHIRPSDIHLKHFEERADRLLIFVVDASGSAAMARLAEAKGAVELLLAQAYARRDHVALIAFRGTTAETLLPPTRSLVQTKRRLAQLPGGGGTPLAAGLHAAADLAEQAKRRGMTPTIALLTDGRANIAFDGTANRAQAADDAQTRARMLAQMGTDAIVIDTGRRPEAALRTLSETLGAHYVPMPRADAQSLSDAVSTALDA